MVKKESIQAFKDKFGAFRYPIDIHIMGAKEKVGINVNKWLRSRQTNVFFALLLLTCLSGSWSLCWRYISWVCPESSSRCPHRPPQVYPECRTSSPIYPDTGSQGQQHHHQSVLIRRLLPDPALKLKWRQPWPGRSQNPYRQISFLLGIRTGKTHILLGKKEHGANQVSSKRLN